MRTMRSLIGVVVLTWCALTADGATRTLLLLEDQTAVGLCGRSYRDWKNQIASEGWAIKTVPIARWDRNWSTNPWPALNRMSNAVAWAQPDAIQIFGSLPYLQTGGHAADGHQTRRIHTDAWLGCTNLVLTDTTDWGLTWTGSAVGTNVPGDGFPDQLAGYFHIPVSRIDAAGLTSVAGNFASGYLAGTQVYQATDEGFGLRAYLTNNLDYRRRVFAFAELGRIDTGWLNPSAITSTNLSVTWTTGAGASSAAGLTNRWHYSGSEWGLASPNFVTAGGEFSSLFWLVTFKSYHMDECDGAQYLRRPLFPGWNSRPSALLSSWGYGAFASNPYWVGRASDQTVADAIVSSVVQSSGGTPLVANFMRHWIVGDVTLPCDPITATPKGGTSGTTLKILTP